MNRGFGYDFIGKLGFLFIIFSVVMQNRFPGFYVTTEKKQIGFWVIILLENRGFGLLFFSVFTQKCFPGFTQQPKKNIKKDFRLWFYWKPGFSVMIAYYDKKI